MRVSNLLPLLLVAVALIPAPDVARAQGINLAWDDCYLGAATIMKTFACDTDAGAPFTLIGSFVPPAGVDQLVGMTAILDLCTMPVVLPDRWRVGNGDCREGAITVVPARESSWGGLKALYR